MDYQKRLISLIIAVILFAFAAASESEAQNSGYEIIPSPDIWYNDVDGILLGARLRGQVPGSFEDGPHRLEAGIWLGTWLPSLPVSYSLSYTEPIDQWSDFGSEASFQMISSVRTGYHEHGLGFNKRWQQGFDERRYREMSLFVTNERRFDDEYVPFPVLWGDDNKFLLKLEGEIQDDNRLGWYNIRFNSDFKMNDDRFAVASFIATQQIPFNEDWGLRFRGFLGTASSSTAPEYLFSRGLSQPLNWLDSRTTRAKGTIPQPWLNSGNMHIAGGPNLRGYAKQDIDFLNSGYFDLINQPNVTVIPPEFPIQYTSFAAFNAEFDYLNPIHMAFRELPYIAEFIRFRSYLFFDAGRSLRIQDTEPDTVLANAGAGFSLSFNIPDFRGKPRGFVLRYEIPLWLSEPGPVDDSFAFRNLIGFGAVISF